MRRLAAALALALAPATAGAEILLSPGFSAESYVGGDGFDVGGTTPASGLPSMSTLAVDDAGALYLARTGRRYFGGAADDLWPLYRVAPGGVHINPGNEGRYLYGPPLPNAAIGGTRGGRELLVTTYDRDRKIGVLYALRDGHAELLAGGTPPPGVAPLLTQPEGAAVDGAGNIYVADRARGVVLKLDSTGRVLDGRFLVVSRPRLVGAGAGEGVWVSSDGDAEAPWQHGSGRILLVEPGGAARVVLRGPVAAAMALSPSGTLFVADRRGARILTVDMDGRTTEFARFTEGDAPRGLAFAPITPETRRAGLAGALFVVVIRHGAFRSNEVVRISGPFDAGR